MTTLSPNLYIATLGPLLELVGVVIIVGVFALLRWYAERRAYFAAWELAFVLFAVSLTAGLFYERFIDPDSVFHPAAPLTTAVFAGGYLALLLVSMAHMVRGAMLFARGTAPRRLPHVAAVVGAGMVFAFDTQYTPLANLSLFHGWVGFVAYGVAAWTFGALPASRQTSGTRLAMLAFAGLAALSGALAAFYDLQLVAPAITGNPWLVRFARYGFYLELLTRFALAFAMVRLVVEDGRRESDDTRVHMKLVQERERLGDLYDERTRLLARRAFDSLVGLDFARATFGSVAHIVITNRRRVASDLGEDAAESLLAHLGGVVDSAVRAHDRVYRWSPDSLLVVMPRATASVARARIEQIVARAAPLVIGGARDPIKAEAAITIRTFDGSDSLVAAAADASAA